MRESDTFFACNEKYICIKFVFSFRFFAFFIPRHHRLNVLSLRFKTSDDPRIFLPPLLKKFSSQAKKREREKVRYIKKQYEVEKSENGNEAYVTVREKENMTLFPFIHSSLPPLGHLSRTDSLLYQLYCAHLMILLL